MFQISRLGYVALILSLVTGCEQRPPSAIVVPSIPDDSYVRVMAELTRLRRRPPIARGQFERDRLADSVRTEVMERHGVTATEIAEFADVVGSDPRRMQTLAERIAALADSLDADSARADSIVADSGATDSAGRAAGSDNLVPIPGTGTLDSRSGRAAGDSTRLPNGEPQPRFADPALAAPADSGARTDTPDVRPGPERTRRPIRRPPPTPAPDSTSDQSNAAATEDESGAV